MASLGLSELTHCPRRFGCDFKNSNYVLLIGILYDNALRWMPQNITDDKSTLVQVIAWCRQATSHYLSQCWPKSLSPYNVTWPQWINSLAPGRGGSQFKTMNFKLVIQDNSFGAHCEIALMWMPQDLTNGKSTWLQVTAWCLQATSHYLIYVAMWCHKSTMVKSDFRLSSEIETWFVKIYVRTQIEKETALQPNTGNPSRDKMISDFIYH